LLFKFFKKIDNCICLKNKNLIPKMKPKPNKTKSHERMKAYSKKLSIFGKIESSAVLSYKHETKPTVKLHSH